MFHLQDGPLDVFYTYDITIAQPPKPEVVDADVDITQHGPLLLFPRFVPFANSNSY